MATSSKFKQTPEDEFENLPIDEGMEELNQSTQRIQIIEESSKDETPAEFHPDDWFEAEGELAIDVYQTDKDIVIQTAVAGVRPEELDVSVENDTVTVRGIRKNPNEKEERQYLHEECYWGPFSRQVFLPEEIDVKNVEASMKDGVLTLRLPKMRREQTRKIKIAKK